MMIDQCYTTTVNLLGKEKEGRKEEMLKARTKKKRKPLLHSFQKNSDNNNKNKNYNYN